MGMDYVVQQASLRGIRLVLVFANYWAMYGGIDQYNIWSFEAGSGAPSHGRLLLPFMSRRLGRAADPPFLVVQRQQQCVSMACCVVMGLEHHQEHVRSMHLARPRLGPCCMAPHRGSIQMLQMAVSVGYRARCQRCAAGGGRHVQRRDHVPRRLLLGPGGRGLLQGPRQDVAQPPQHLHRPPLPVRRACRAGWASDVVHAGRRGCEHLGMRACIKHRCKALVAAVAAPKSASGCGHVHQCEACEALWARISCAAPQEQRISAWGRACVPAMGRRMSPHGM